MKYTKVPIAFLPSFVYSKSKFRALQYDDLGYTDPLFWIPFGYTLSKCSAV